MYPSVLRYSLLLCTLLALTLPVLGDDKTVEEPLSIAKLFDNLNSHFQNATAVVESVLDTDIPSTQVEVKAALDNTLTGLKASAEKIQKKLSEYNVTGSTLTGIVTQLQTEVNRTVEDLAKRNPDLGKLLGQVKSGYTSLAEVSQRVQDVVGDQATHVSDELKGVAQQARAELSKAATQLETKVQELIADAQKKSKTS